MNKKAVVPLRFFAATFAWSWLFFLPLVLAGFGVIRVSPRVLAAASLPVTVIAAFGPAFGAFFSIRTLEGKGAFRAYARSFFDIRFPLKAWFPPIGVLLITTIVAWFVPELFGSPRVPMMFPSAALFPLYWLIMVFFGGGQEEIGWRGYILPRLEARYGVIAGSSILAVIWACWHIPLWFIPGTSQTFMNFAGFMMLTMGYSFLFSWGVKACGGKPLFAMIMHGSANAFVPFFPVIIMAQGVAQPRFWLWVSLTLACGIPFVLLASRAQKKLG